MKLYYKPTTLGFILIAILVIALIAVGPLVTIWCLNTLFSTGIAYTFTNWLATTLLQLTIHGLIKGSK